MRENPALQDVVAADGDAHAAPFTSGQLEGENKVSHNRRSGRVRRETNGMQVPVPAVLYVPGMHKEHCDVAALREYPATLC